MYPKIFGVIDSYVVMVLLGVALAIVVFCLYFIKKVKISKIELIDLLIVSVVTIFFGIIFACLFENIYEWIKNQKIVWTWGMTFYGGLIGGAGTFILMYCLYYLKRHKDVFGEILIIAPGLITLAHGVGRIGCFLAGCCYGKETDSFIGVTFPNIEPLGVKRIPTQLIEAAFLFVLSAILLVFAFKSITKYTMIIYLASYSVFRFVIEYFRDDPRGQFLALSPSQIWCIILFAITPLLVIVFKKFIFKKNYESKN